MKILKIRCVDSSSCHNNIKVSYPNVVEVSHINDKHIVLMRSDFDSKGKLPKSIHLLAWKFGGVRFRKNDKIIPAPKLSSVEKLMLTNAETI